MQLMKRNSKPKRRRRRAQNNHAIRRAEERYGFDLDTDDLKYLSSKIKNQSFNYSASLVQTNSRSLHLFDYQGVEVLVVYNNNTGSISTFLPSGTIPEYFTDKEENED